MRGEKLWVQKKREMTLSLGKGPYGRGLPADHQGEVDAGLQAALVRVLLAEVVELLGAQLPVHQSGGGEQGDGVQGREDAPQPAPEERVVDRQDQLRHRDRAVVVHVQHVKQVPDLRHDILLKELHQEPLGQEVDRSLLYGGSHLEHAKKHAGRPRHKSTPFTFALPTSVPHAFTDSIRTAASFSGGESSFSGLLIAGHRVLVAKALHVAPWRALATEKRGLVQH